MDKLAQVSIGSTFLGNNSTFQGLESVGSLVSLFLRIAFVLAGLILLFYFILGGIGMISSAGKDDQKAAEAAKQTITSAVIGFVVVFAAYWIVKLIGKLFGIPNII
jgi:cytochrome bd-type quinol oxidase subunit 2